MGHRLDDAIDVRTERQANEAGATLAGDNFVSVAAGQSLVVQYGGTLAGTRPIVNFVPGTNVTLTVSDNAVQNRVDVTVAASTAALAVSTKSANYTLTDADDVILVDCAGGARTITLHAVATAKRKVYRFKKIDASANAMTLDGSGAETIDGAATQATSTQYAVFSLVPDSVSGGWFIL